MHFVPSKLLLAISQVYCHGGCADGDVDYDLVADECHETQVEACANSGVDGDGVADSLLEELVV